MSESFEGRYILCGPKVYIRPNGTVIFDDSKARTVFNEMPAGIWVWVECDEQNVGLPSHWADIRDLVDGYLATLQEWADGSDSAVENMLLDKDKFPR